MSVRYRIRRKLDAVKNAAPDTDGGKRAKKGKGKQKEQIIKKVEESIEKILNIDDIDETPFMEYFRRSSSYVLYGLAPTARKSICLLPLPVKLSFCQDVEDDVRETPAKKTRAKKEKQSAPPIRSRPPLSETVSRKAVEVAKSVPKPPTVTNDKPQKSQPTRAAVRRQPNEQIKHINEEEQPVKKVIGVESPKKKNKKQYQIIGKEVKIKPKHSASPPAPPTSTRAPPVVTTPPPPPRVEIPTTTRAPPPPPKVETPAPRVVVSTTTTTQAPPPVVTAPPPRVEVPQTTPEPILTSTTEAPLRSIAELIQEEASTLLSATSIFPEEAKEEIEEDVPTVVTESTPPTENDDDDDDDSTSDGEAKEDNEDVDNDDEESSSSDTESNSDDSGNDTKEESEESKENFDPLALKKMKKFYETAKESVFDSSKDQN